MAEEGTKRESDWLAASITPTFEMPFILPCCIKGSRFCLQPEAAG